MASPELNSVIEMLRSMRTFDEPSVEQVREGMRAMTAGFVVPNGVRLEPVDAGGARGEWTRVADVTGRRTVLYLHGGGYCVGGVETHRDLVCRLAAASEATVLSLDYRLAPEAPFPAAIEDAASAYCWLLSEGHRPDNIAIAGDSAGGGLTMATLVALRDAGEKLPAAAVCLSPWVDLKGEGASMDSRAAADPLLDRAGLKRFAGWYLGDTDASAPLASPIHADLSGLPPLLIHVGDAEVLLDDAIRLDERARDSGVETELDVWDEMIHVWHAMASILPEGQEAIERIGDYLRKRVRS